VGHGTTVAEAGSEDLRLIDTQIGGQVINEGINKGDVLSTTVGPASIKAIGSNENSTALGQTLKTIPAVGDIIHGSTEPVEAKDEL
jgi:hypothetical protein